jgi:NADPH:quinone reductase-like Zn-dependent oxidoreductase
MKAYGLHGSGFDALRLGEIADPPAPAAGQVLVRMRAASVNFRDLMVVNGVFGTRVPPGLVPLSDGAGEVVAIGAGVSRTQPGDRVAITFYPYEAEVRDPAQAAAQGRGLAGHGVLAGYSAVSEHDVVRLPGHLDYEHGATLPCAAVTAWCALCAGGQPLPGETVLVQGSGGVSIFALQFARLFGARVIALSSSEAKLKRLRALGADAVVDYVRNPEWQDRVLALTEGAGVERVIEVGGAQTLARSISATRHGGRLSIVGLLTGMPAIGADFFARGLHFDTIHVGRRQHFEQLLRAMQHHATLPVFDRVFDFADAVGALQHLAAHRHFGKVVIRIE